MSETSDSTQSEVQSSVYERCDADYLRQLHAASGMDETQLARIACLSVAQVRQLIAGGDSLFYSPAVKRQAYKRLLLILGAPPPSQLATEAQASATPYDAAPPRQTIDDIVALSERHQYLEHKPWVDFFQDLRVRIVQYRQPLAALSLLVVAISLLVTNWPSKEEGSLLAGASSADTVKPASLMAETNKGELGKAEAGKTEPGKADPSKLEAIKPEPATHDKTADKEVAATVPTVSTAPIAQPSPTPVTSAVAPASKACAYRSEKLPEGAPAVVTKEGRYVYFVSPVATDVCVVDGNRQATTLTLRPGEGRSVYGAPPWQVSGADLGKMQIFFQGSRVVLPEGAAQQGMALQEKPL